MTSPSGSDWSTPTTWGFRRLWRRGASAGWSMIHSQVASRSRRATSAVVPRPARRGEVGARSPVSLRIAGRCSPGLKVGLPARSFSWASRIARCPPKADPAGTQAPPAPIYRDPPHAQDPADLARLSRGTSATTATMSPALQLLHAPAHRPRRHPSSCTDPSWPNRHITQQRLLPTS